MDSSSFSNVWVARSMELASTPGYLDKLGRVYKVDDPVPRDIDPKKLEKIEQAFRGGDDETLLKSLLKLKRFPYNETFARLFKLPNQGFDENPETFSRIIERIRSMEWEELEKAIKAPKEDNRRMGALFTRWFEQWFDDSGYDVVSDEDLLRHTGVAKLVGGEQEATEFAREHLGYEGTKRPDLLVKVRGKYVVGEAKFFSDTGGNQDGKFRDAMDLVNNQGSFIPEARAIAIMDGLIWKEGNSRNFRILRSTEHDVMSVLLLPEYVNGIS